MSFSNYPKVKLPLGRVSLNESHPAWFLDPRGVIQAANLLSFWLWEALRPGEAIQIDTLLGKSVFNILAANLKRIPVDLNSNFYEKKSAVVKRMDAGLRSSLYTSFISVMEADPQLKQIFDNAAPIPNREWEYTLRIIPPGVKDSNQLLEFEVTIYRLTGDNGLLVVYIPTQATLPIVEKQFNLLNDKYGNQAYVQCKNMKQEDLKSIQVAIDQAIPSPTYYPSLRHDLLWYITENNDAQQLLFGESVIGKHFFEMILSAPFREWQGPLYETAGLRAVKYFDTLTAEFRREDHELHIAYEQIMKRLLQLPDFRELLDISRKIPIRINLPENPEVPFYTCRVLLPWPISNDFTLQFRSMSQLLHEGSLNQMDIANDIWNVTLVPENFETEAALILLRLLSVALSSKSIGNTQFKQFLWGLAVMKTVEEGLMMVNEGLSPQPLTAFKRIHKDLKVNSKLALSGLEDITTQLRIIIETLDRTGILDKETMLNMMIDFIGNNVLLSGLKQYLTTELRIHKRVEERLRVIDVPQGKQETEQVMLEDASGKGRMNSLQDDEMKTVVFDSKEEYERFTDYVFEEFEGAGLTFTDVPIITSVRVTPQLLGRMQEQFNMRPVSDEDIMQAQGGKEER